MGQRKFPMFGHPETFVWLDVTYATILKAINYGLRFGRAAIITDNNFQSLVSLGANCT